MTYKEAKEQFAKEQPYLADHNWKMAYQLAEQALEKQIPKKPLRGRCGTLCPSCHRLEYIVQRDALDTHCGFCGQAIDWSD